MRASCADDNTIREPYAARATLVLRQAQDQLQSPVSVRQPLARLRSAETRTKKVKERLQISLPALNSHIHTNDQTNFKTETRPMYFLRPDGK
jgi:hypothetical protein